MSGPFDALIKAADGPVGVAVSGGGDSVALLVLLVEAGADVRAVTVDHGLRPDAGAEARGVADLCDRLGVPHDVLTWTDTHHGNLQASARQARYQLMSQWAAQSDIAHIALGHTLDDQAETVLMRLRRGSGVDGLSGMAPRVERFGLTWWRPLLDMRREELRALLQARSIRWIEDPTNEDDRYERVRVRRALTTLEDLGLTVEALAETAQRMARARGALEAATHALARMAAQPRETGAVRLARAPLEAAEAEIRFRLLAHALMWVSTAAYRPRMSSLQAAWSAVSTGQAQTLHGCRLMPRDDGMEIVREINAMPERPAGGLYDGRWVTATASGSVRPLGADGLRNCSGWRDLGESRAALEATPALWRNGELRFAPFARKSDDWECRLAEGTEGFFASIRSH